MATWLSGEFCTPKRLTGIHYPQCRMAMVNDPSPLVSNCSSVCFLAKNLCLVRHGNTLYAGHFVAYQLQIESGVEGAIANEWIPSSDRYVDLIPFTSVQECQVQNCLAEAGGGSNPSTRLFPFIPTIGLYSFSLMQRTPPHPLNPRLMGKDELPEKETKLK
ncbi:hypothetical protein EGR_11090 [Echinococcus granulosus]|uniref:Uncharacterized protein n=1 Tax=Echinococcus granulosus TaxID=6210 RepID=W6U6T2_ECHGR|nr:hypothetical protein EGR_11090 [Echinococcus granulosus]EUB54052.1 hypothetical protein EGR_11090 [Echinococcus granulosus]